MLQFSFVILINPVSGSKNTGGPKKTRLLILQAIDPQKSYRLRSLPPFYDTKIASLLPTSSDLVGEQGSGFAAIADEVRTLAQRTQQSTSDITKMITLLQQQISEAHELMGNSLEKVNLNITSVEQAGLSFSNTNDAIEQNLVGASAIAAAAEEQTQTLIVIQQNVDQIKLANEQTLTITVSTTEANKELVQLSLDINQLAEKFKV